MLRNLKTCALAAVLAAAAALPALAQGSVATPRFEHAIPNIPGKSLIAVEVNFAPGAASMPHHHAGSAFIMAYVISGAIVSQLEGQPEHVFHPGESWYEDPGAHHVVSRNASQTEPAKMLAVFVLDSGDKTLTTPDAPRR